MNKKVSKSVQKLMDFMKEKGYEEYIAHGFNEAKGKKQIVIFDFGSSDFQLYLCDKLNGVYGTYRTWRWAPINDISKETLEEIKTEITNYVEGRRDKDNFNPFTLGVDPTYKKVTCPSCNHTVVNLIENKYTKCYFCDDRF